MVKSIRIIAGIFTLALAFVGGSDTLTAAGCGIQPIKPITPLGCKDLVPSCVCDSSGQKCTWQWICVKA